MRAVSGVTILSRLGGMLREVMLVRIFGDTALGSAFAAGFAVPNLFRRLFGEGALSAAFIPEYAKAVGEDEGEGSREQGAGSSKEVAEWQSGRVAEWEAGNREQGAGSGEGNAAGALASLTLRWLGLITGGITVLVEIGLLLLLVFGEHTPERAVSLKFIMVMLPFMPLVCSAAILSGMLQVHGRFGPSVSGPIVLNVFVVAAGLTHIALGWPEEHATGYVLGAATVLSGVTQCLWFAKLLRPHVRWTGDTHAARARAAAMLRKFVPVVVGSGAMQISTFCDTLLAMWPIWVGPTVLGYAFPMDEKSNIILSASQRLYQFPLGVFGIAVATAAFPMLSRSVGDAEQFAATMRRGLRLSLFIALPASVGMMLVSRDAIGVFYGGSVGSNGEAALEGFSAESIGRAASVLAWYASGIWAYSINHVFARVMYARGDTKTPMRVSVACVCIAMALNVTLMWPMREAGLAAASAAAAVVQVAIMGAVCRRTLGSAVLDEEARWAVGRLVLAAAAMGVAVWGVLAVLGEDEAWAWHVVRLAAGSLTGMGVYAAAAWMMKTPELRWLASRGGQNP